MFILLLEYVKPLSEVDALMEAHRAYLARAYAEGRLIASGRKVPRTGGVMLARFQDRDEADAFVRGDPFHQSGVARYEVTQVQMTQSDPRLGDVRWDG